MQLTHLFDLVQVDNETGVEVVQVFDALSTENGGVLAAVEMLDPLVVILANIDGAILLVRLFALVGLGVSLQALFEVD